MALERYSEYSNYIENIALVGIELTYKAIRKIVGWWQGHVSSRDVSEAVLDGILIGGVVGGAGGAGTGAAIGTVVGGPIGLAIGGAIGGIVGVVGGAVVGANEARANLARRIFGRERYDALDTAYSFLGVGRNASNSEINNAYRNLSRRYHPDKGGSRDDWAMLQSSLGVIRSARGADR